MSGCKRSAFSPFQGNKRTFHFLVCLSIALALVAQGCSARYARPAPGSQETPPFLPPTRVPAQSAQMSPPPVETAQPSPTLPCADGLTFIDDLTIPDGGQVKPGAELDKRWEVRNSGSCNWDERYSLRLTAGEPLGAAESLPLYPARSETNAVIRILLQAPLAEGSYRSTWQAHNPAGEPFGDLIFVDIIVEN